MRRANNPSGGTGYVEAEIEAIASWLQEGLSATQIAVKMFERFRRAVSRNAIIGLVHRNKRLRAIGLQSRAPQNRHRPDTAAKAASRRVPASKRPLAKAPAPKDLPGRQKLMAMEYPDRETLWLAPKPAPHPRVIFGAPAEYDAASLRLPISALGDGQCRFPVNDAPDAAGHLFCGLPATRRSYCGHHAARAYGGYRAEAAPARPKQAAAPARMGAFD